MELEPSLTFITEKYDTILNMTPQIDNLSFDFAAGFQDEINHFIEVCRGSKQTLSPVEDGVEMMKILCGIYKSARSGRKSGCKDGCGGEHEKNRVYRLSLDEWHVEHYPAWIEQASSGEMKVVCAYGKVEINRRADERRLVREERHPAPVFRRGSRGHERLSGRAVARSSGVSRGAVRLPLRSGKPTTWTKRSRRTVTRPSRCSRRGAGTGRRSIPARAPLCVGICRSG